jgi:hypothetical protein
MGGKYSRGRRPPKIKYKPNPAPCFTQALTWRLREDFEKFNVMAVIRQSLRFAATVKTQHLDLPETAL